MVLIRFFLFSLKNSTLPSKFNNLFLMNSQIHNYNTRNAHSFHLPLEWTLDSSQSISMVQSVIIRWIYYNWFVLLRFF